MNAQVAYALITHPTLAMRKVRTTKALGTGVVMLVAGSVSLAVAFALLKAEATGAKAPAVIAAYVALVTLTSFAWWLFMGGLVHAAAGLMGGYGNFGRFLAAAGLALAPFTLCTPIVLLLSLLGGLGGVLYMVPILPLIHVWAWVLLIIGIKEVYGLSVGSAIVASLLPFLIIAALTLASLATLVVTVLMSLGIC